MREGPLLFSAPMVGSTLRDIDPKRHTRRVAKFKTAPGLNLKFSGLEVHRFGASWAILSRGAGAAWEERSEPLRSPYGLEGDRLYVKETFFAFGRWETRFSARKGRDEWHFIDMTRECGHRYRYAAGDSMVTVGAKGRGGVLPMWWTRPAIFMPRVASRILLEVVGIRVERLLDISEADAIAEGIERLPSGEWKDYGDPTDSCADPISSYRTLWEAINGFQSSKDNPFVWVVEFKRITP